GSTNRDAPDYAVVLAVNGDLELTAGDVAGARSDFERALAIRRQALGASHPLVAEAQVSLAATLARAGDIGEAFRNALDAERVGREHLRLMLQSLPQRESLNYARTRPRALDLILSLATQQE